ncbi:9211_t:CDS:2, partial [Entrophospora sp. SA101]
MSQLQKSNPFGELSALAARIKLKATISGAHRLLPQQKTLLNQSSSSLTSTCLGTEGYSNMRYDLGQSYPSSLGPIFFSINDDIEKEIFHTSYENVGHVEKWTRTFGKGYLLYKLDTKDQYSILPVDPLSKHYKGLPVLTRSLLSVIEIQPGPFVDRDTDDYKQTEELQILHCDAELRSILVGFP